MPTISGSTVLARDHVRMISRRSAPCMASTFSSRLGCTKGPFFVERDMAPPYLRPLPRRRTMNLSVDLLLRVR